MPRYTGAFNKTGADNVQQIVEALSGATVQRVKVTSFVVKDTGTEASDISQQFSLRRVTGTATGTALTPSKTPGDAAARSSVKHLITADHSSFNTAPDELWRSPANNRSSYQIFLPDDQAFEGAAVNANGISLGVSVATPRTFAGTLGFFE